ncbi:MAG: magnesium/cobalt efflux protein [Gammaproteobacteria bacterium]|nr:MAG: magnesium/cobalt efflux protein [Gammaproteobacteria bacterium]
MNNDQPPSGTSRKLSKKFFGLFNKKSSKEDLREYLKEAHSNSIIGTEEVAMLIGVLSVFEQRVRDVMVPKTKMVILGHDMSFDESLDIVMDSGHSRFPVECDGNIIGILLAKDLLGHIHDSDKVFDITQLMRPVRHIPESKPLNVLLREFRSQRLHMAIVTNEYGNIAGLVTIEDVLEEIVGEIDDEHDSEDDLDIKKLENNGYVVAALTSIEDFNRFFHTELDKEKYDTIGGLVLSRFGYVPQAGEKVTFEGIHFIINHANDRRIIDIVVSKK